MGVDLETLTMWFNALAMAVSFSLGMYLVTRDPRNRSAWLAALTAWSLAAYFLNNALSIQVPESTLIPLLRMITLFSLPFWLNLVVFLRRDQPDVPSGGRIGSVNKIALPAAYLISAALIIVQLLNPDNSFIYTAQALILSDWQTGQLYPLAVAIMFLEGLLSMANLRDVIQAARSKIVKRQFAILLSATVLSGSGALFMAIGVWQALEAPSLIGDFFIFVGVVLLGYVVARYNAFIEGRTVKRDLLYVFILIGSLTLINVIIALTLFFRGHVFSFVTLMLIMVVAITSLMLYDGFRSALDRLFYRDQYRKLRGNLRAMAQEAGSGRSLAEQLQAVLRALTLEYDLTGGFIALKQNGHYDVVASRQSVPVNQTFKAEVLDADDVVTDLALADAAPGKAAIVAPIYDSEGQIGALVVDSDRGNWGSVDEDLLFLEEMADELSGIITASRLQQAYAAEIDATVEAYRKRERALQRQVDQLTGEGQISEPSTLAGIDDRGFRKLVEDSLRHLDDFTYLGQHQLAELAIVEMHVSGGGEEFVTHIDRGKGLSEVVVMAINKLKPDGQEPGLNAVPPREWYQYVILHDAYVKGVMNRDIMSRLYISEGMFNRSRRQALRGVSRALQEMELEAARRNAAAG